VVSQIGALGVFMSANRNYLPNDILEIARAFKDVSSDEDFQKLITKEK
jgi:hypothetical protein